MTGSRNRRGLPPIRALRRGGFRFQLLVLVVGALLATTVAAVASPSMAAADTPIREDIQIRGKGGNCLTASSSRSGAFVTMEQCTGLSTQDWDIINWNTSDAWGRGIRLAGTNNCLGIQGRSVNSRARAKVELCVPLENRTQSWEVSGEVQRLWNHSSGKCLDVMYGDIRPGTAVWQWGCNSSAAQQWIMGARSYVGAIMGHGANCLTMDSSSPADGDRAYMSDCLRTPRQTWTVVGDYITIGGKCLDIRGANPASGTPVQTWTCYDVPQQRWQLRAEGDIKSRLANVCLDVAYAGTQNGTEAWSWACNNSYAQGWYTNKLPQRFITTGALATQLNGALATRLANCQGMVNFNFGQLNIVAMRNPAPFVVERTGNSFTDAASATATNWTNRAAINGAWFDPVGGANPLEPQGDIYENGRRIRTNPYGNVYQGFYVKADRTESCGQWEIGPQSNARAGQAPPSSSNFAMGGARPLIINGSKWGRADEGLPNYFGDILRFEDYETFGGSPINGKPTIGVRDDGIVMLIVQRQSVPGQSGNTRLTAIRDAYELLGFDDAVLFDPNTSATLTVNGQVRAEPQRGKNSAITTGLAIATR